MTVNESRVGRKSGKTSRNRLQLLLTCSILMVLGTEAGPSIQQQQPPPPPPPPPKVDASDVPRKILPPPPPPRNDNNVDKSLPEKDLLLERFEKLVKPPPSGDERRNDDKEASSKQEDSVHDIQTEETTIDDPSNASEDETDVMDLDQEGAPIHLVTEQKQSEEITMETDSHDSMDEFNLGDAAVTETLLPQKSSPLPPPPPPPPAEAAIDKEEQEETLLQPTWFNSQQPIHPPPPPQEDEQSAHHQQQFQQPHYHQQQQFSSQEYAPPGLQNPRYNSQWSSQQQQQQQPQPYRPPAGNTQQVWKSLWKRVEQSLDGLATVEERVASRANQWTHQVTGRARVMITKPTMTYFRSTRIQRHDPAQPFVPPSNKFDAPPAATPPTTETRTNEIGEVPSRRAFGSAANVPSTTLVPSKNTTPIRKSPISELYATYNSAPPQSTAAATTDESDDDEQVTRRANLDWQRVILSGHNTATPKPAVPRAGASNSNDQQQHVYGRKSSPFMQLQQEQQYQQQPQQQEEPVAQSASLTAFEREEASIFSRLSNALPTIRMPSFVLKVLGRGSGAYRTYTDTTMDVWKADEEKQRSRQRNNNRSQNKQSVIHQGSRRPDSKTPPLDDLLTRCNGGKSTMILTPQEIRQSKSIGRNKAVWDIGSLLLAVVGIQQVASLVATSGSSATLAGNIVPILSAFAESAQGWTLYAFAASFLTAATKNLIFDRQIETLSSSIGSKVEGSSQYAQLYLRLVAGTPVDKNVPGRILEAAQAQIADVVQSNRLRTFVVLTVAMLVLETVSVARQIMMAILTSFTQVITLPELTTWPIAWGSAGTYLKEILLLLATTVKELLVDEFTSFKQNPMAIAFQLSLFAALFSVTFLPLLEQYRKVDAIDEDEGEDETDLGAFGTVSTLSNLGVSSASRLGMLSKSGALEGTLERWRAALPPATERRSIRSLQSFVRQTGYLLLSVLALLAPIGVFFNFVGGGGLSKGVVSTGPIQFHSIWDVAVVLMFAARLSWGSIARSMESSSFRPHLLSFLTGLAQVVDEASGNTPGAQRQLGSSTSPTLGLSVRDLWAAHTTKRAWAVRGATFDCNNGEVVAILGDDGAGRTRLLTAIAEAFVNPAKRSLTTTKVRGSVSLGGLDTSKWSREELKKRLGLFLNDVRTIADNAEFMSGFTLEEILQPMDGLLKTPNQPVGANERTAINNALQITGLSSSMLPRLPSKLSTVVTANENELTPSALRPRCHSLAPSEWSKLLLARVLAQTIYDNDSLSNSILLGSLLILDDLTNNLSELEELKILQALRSTGAATIFTSNKWASGRLADRIVVVKDGAIAEVGSHNELLSKGPQQSVYASKWHSMATG